MPNFLETTIDKFTFKVATTVFTATKVCGRAEGTASGSACLISCSSTAVTWPLQRSNLSDSSLLSMMKWQ